MTRILFHYVRENNSDIFRTLICKILHKIECANSWAARCEGFEVIGDAKAIAPIAWIEYPKSALIWAFWNSAHFKSERGCGLPVLCAAYE